MEQVPSETQYINGGGSRLLVSVADFREIIDFRNENLRASTAPCSRIRGRWYERLPRRARLAGRHPTL
jgi:hypothetical protein